MENQPAQVFRTNTADGLPAPLERRLVLRLLGIWRSLRDDRPWPSFADLDPAQIADLWPHCFVLELMGAERRPVFRAVGPDFARLAKPPPIGQPVSEAPADSLAAAATAYVAEVLQKRVPISRGGVRRGPGDATLPYRSILLPMGDDDVAINGLLGAANCRDAPGE